ncbi:MAG: C39 family peptidase [Faecousia sp.]
MKTKRRTVIAAAIAVLLMAMLLGARPAYNLYRDISFYHGERTEAEKTVKAFAEEKGISYGEYPQSLIDLYERNPETKDFVLNYPFRKELEIDLSAYRDSQTVPLFLQWNPMWGYEKYGSGCIAVTGCGPACLAMVGYYYTGDGNMNPCQIARFAQENGYYQTGYGSSWKLISEGSEKLGLKATEIPLVKKKMVDALEAGKPIICAMGPGDFTTTGHYIVLRGVVDGAFLVNDPNSVVNSEKLWRYDQIEGQIRNLWVMEKV